ncbi:hypothetical protein HQ865_01065 [Mucilaginibacter mali]|uniref:Methylamine utilisation protein MauE domain-containing protein n=1 Tax=Mucilaginibacter mali TaxID=2740462 RepID=A0A7D4PYS3_9SPHI|nr:MauE/DoxX family redox-associated membrane protein [Mucilaginibacter mali]QKJ28406.1 hypothetical protein HQ865_01065 [Mucilaginibacter mali]
MKKEIIADILVTLIFMMFLYAAFSKYFDFSGFKRAMGNQPFPVWLSQLLVIVLPPAEVITATLLLFEKTRKSGLIATIILMITFTFYIIAILLHLYPAEPCTCGGIIRLLTWKQHLLFNLFFIAIAVISLKITPGKRQEIARSARSSL